MIAALANAVSLDVPAAALAPLLWGVGLLVVLHAAMRGAARAPERRATPDIPDRAVETEGTRRAA